MKTGVYLILNKNGDVVCECNCMYDAELIVMRNPTLSWLYIKGRRTSGW